ncbi:MAG: hypothetical protein JWP03_1347 [Phycisphaerales bacterium]|nr:hypothetical protein [Phycisphaerales bacterium]
MGTSLLLDGAREKHMIDATRRVFSGYSAAVVESLPGLSEGYSIPQFDEAAGMPDDGECVDASECVSEELWH